MNKIEIFNNYNEEVKEIEEIRKLIYFAIDYKKLDNLEFNVIFVDNNYIHELNKNYRGIDRPTDVITFALEDGVEVDINSWRILGDIYISIDKAREQAESYGHSLKREIFFLTIHGLLHLLGYDHMKEEEEKEMFRLQELILDGYGIKR